jgi:hypothetical protein
MEVEVQVVVVVVVVVAVAVVEDDCGGVGGDDNFIKIQ